MSLLHESEIPTDEAHRFRAPTIDAALADARAALGDDVRIVEANRIRRGGVGGFFATDLGVELVVAIGDDAGPTDDLDAEAMPDPEYLDVPLNGRQLPRASTSPSARPHFYDRVIEESAPEAKMDAPASVTATAAASPGIQRLLDTAASTERGRPSSAAARATFADHLARHLDDGGAVNPTVVVPRSTQVTAAPSEATEVATVDTYPATAPAAEVVATVALVDRPAPTATEAGADAEDEAPVPAPDPPTRVAAPVTDADGSVEVEVEVEAAQADGPTPRSTSRSTSRSAASRSRDPLRRPIDLAAGAVGRIVEQLSDVSPVEGSRMGDLSRLVVRVTTPDGSTIEIEAELHGAGRG